MALPGNSVSVNGTLSWTRGEFSVDSVTDIFEGPSTNFADATNVATVLSGVTSRGLRKTVVVGSTQTFRYWVRHRLANGTVGTLVGPVTGTYTAPAN
jgi:hypothetical protein